MCACEMCNWIDCDVVFSEDAPPGRAVVGEQRQRWHLQQQCCRHYHLSGPTLEGARSCGSCHMLPTAVCPDLTCVISCSATTTVPVQQQWHLQQQRVLHC